MDFINKNYNIHVTQDILPTDKVKIIFQYPIHYRFRHYHSFLIICLSYMLYTSPYM